MTAGEGNDEGIVTGEYSGPPRDSDTADGAHVGCSARLMDMCGDGYGWLMDRVNAGYS